MRYLTHALTDGTETELSTNGSLEYVHAGRFIEKSVQVVFTGTVTADVVLEGTIDEINWVTLSTVTASAIIVVAASVAQLRVSVSNWTEGTVSATFAGFDPRVGY